MTENKASIRQLLKTETSALHKEIEDAFNILDVDFDLIQYKAILRKFYGFYLPIELAIADFAPLPESLEWILRQKVSLLEKDLRALGLRNFDSVALCLDLPPLRTKAEIFGVLYVLEGSTLGGQVISKHLNKKLQITPESNGGFYSSYGVNTGPMWRKFISSLEVEVIEDKDQQQAIHAAQETFRKLTVWLEN